MNYFKRTEKYLYNYHGIIAGIKNAEQELQQALNEYIGTSAVDITKEQTSPTFKFSSATEDEIIEKEKIIECLKRKIANEKMLISNINNAVEALNKEEKELIKLRYFQALPWNEVARKLNYSPDHCRGKMRAGVIKRVAIGVFGISKIEKCEVENTSGTQMA